MPGAPDPLSAGEIAGGGSDLNVVEGCETCQRMAAYTWLKDR